LNVSGAKGPKWRYDRRTAEGALRLSNTTVPNFAGIANAMAIEQGEAWHICTGCGTRWRHVGPGKSLCYDCGGPGEPMSPEDAATASAADLPAPDMTAALKDRVMDLSKSAEPESPSESVG
jgi:hypothetical protein